MSHVIHIFKWVFKKYSECLNLNMYYNKSHIASNDRINVVKRKGNLVRINGNVSFTEWVILLLLHTIFICVRLALTIKKLLHTIFIGKHGLRPFLAWSILIKKLKCVKCNAITFPLSNINKVWYIGEAKPAF